MTGTMTGDFDVLLTASQYIYLSN